MTTKQPVCTSAAPAAIGPYSQAVRVNNILYISGQTPIDPKTGTLVLGGVQEQTVQCCKNISAILHAVALNSDAVTKTTVYITDMSHFPQVNSIYEKAFSAPYPARSCIATKALPLGCLVEIEAIAQFPS